MNTFEVAARFAQEAPIGEGQVLALVNRPSEGVHLPVDALKLDPEMGIEGDRWFETAWIRLPDGRPDPRVQVSMTNANVMRCFTGEEEGAVFGCGDNIYTDLNLTENALPVGVKIEMGEAVIELSDVVNDSCGKFAQRFGADAFRFIRDKEKDGLRLRGVFCRIVRGGNVRVGDRVRVI